MNILIVDDEYDKVQRISEALNEAGIATDNLRHESTAASARRAIQSQSYDLLLIDLNLPTSLGEQPDSSGGMQFFDMILLDQKSHVPAHVLFITAKEELIQEATSEAIRRGAALCQFDTSKQGWQNILVGKAKFIQSLLERASHKYPSVDVVVVTALRRPELEAVLELAYQWQPLRIPGDASQYHLGEIPRKTGNFSVVAVSAFRKGMPSSAALVSKVCTLFRPKYLVMLGICAGIKGKTNLGDVVVADPTWDWGSGKQSEDEHGSPVFLAAPHQRTLDTFMAQVVGELANSPEILAEVRKGWASKIPGGEFSVHVGPMASGASVLADVAAVREIAIQHREVLAVEMEAYAVMAAAEYANAPIPVSMAIKSVCDYADSEKNDNWQDYASYTSAAFFNLLFRNGNFN